MPNSEFVAVVSGRDVVRVEPAGSVWLTIQDRIRVVLNGDWDPIGVADIAEDEYDMYIAQIHSLLVTNSTEQTIADYLLRIEHERMGLTGTPMNQLLRVAANLRSIQLPPVENSGTPVSNKLTPDLSVSEHESLVQSQTTAPQIALALATAIIRDGL